ncbi:MMPL family transporter [Cryobacterium psychrophilum]|uniref:MMPL family transporter n=1 Tax=Cryobacterium psychrophilum TaxID=41988 RepID=A0A4Y8KSR5_9MICO|nr:MMPL family transporter [Cryobacterium psychrophilum]TDW29660.1 RND superfamily putative drug exporter [Cryobacterium psychrophilum]TFD81774.1 MMPL family transporter [Cryobacterium psychrophilum]
MTDPTRRRDWNPPRWLRIVLPVVLLIIWLTAAAFGGPTFGKLSSVSSNDQAAFLPASAESTRVNEVQQKFTDSQAIPAIVLFVSDTTISPADLASYADVGLQLGAVTGVQAPQAPGAPAVVGPIPSEDGMAVEFIVPISDTEEVDTVVADLRAVADASTTSSTTAYVTGPAGLTADLVAAFAGIDGLLLLVAAGAVFLILLLVYRSIVLPFLVLFTSIFALSAAILLVYAFASWGWIQLSGQSQGILSILVIGAATDYSLLLVARYREALRQVESKWAAMARAWRAALEPIVASGATVIIALLCLLFSDLNSNRSLGPIAAIGIVFSLFASLTLLPVLLVLFGRVAFWPFRPRVGTDDTPARHSAVASFDGLQGVRGLWGRVGGLVARRPRVTWVASVLLLVACSLGLLQLQANGVAQTDIILTQSEAVDGQKVAAEHFPSGAGSPVVIVTDRGNADATLRAVESADGVSSAAIYTGNTGPGAPAEPVVRDGQVLINAVLSSQADSQTAEGVVRTLREDLPATDAGVLVGGVTAIALDTNTTAQSDLVRIIPIVLLVILAILMLLLRSIVAPVLLVASVVVSYAAALGVSAIVFNHVFDFPGADATVPLFGFVFLVALGVDYNIFLMTRVREETMRMGTRPGILRGLAMTGSVITSAGVVLAATFAALAVIPILFLVQIAFIVAFGVLLDTVIVRSLLVPAVSYDIGRAIWWPSKLGRDSLR